MISFFLILSSLPSTKAMETTLPQTTEHRHLLRSEERMIPSFPGESHERRLGGSTLVKKRLTKAMIERIKKGDKETIEMAKQWGQINGVAIENEQEELEEPTLFLVRQLEEWGMPFEALRLFSRTNLFAELFIPQSFGTDKECPLSRQKEKDIYLHIFHQVGEQLKKEILMESDPVKISANLKKFFSYFQTISVKEKGHSRLFIDLIGFFQPFPEEIKLFLLQPSQKDCKVPQDIKMIAFLTSQKFKNFINSNKNNFKKLKYEKKEDLFEDIEDIEEVKPSVGPWENDEEAAFLLEEFISYIDWKTSKEGGYFFDESIARLMKAFLIKNHQYKKALKLLRGHSGWIYGLEDTLLQEFSSADRKKILSDMDNQQIPLESIFFCHTSFTDGEAGESAYRRYHLTDIWIEKMFETLPIPLPVTDQAKALIEDQEIQDTFDTYVERKLTLMDEVPPSKKKNLQKKVIQEWEVPFALWYARLRPQEFQEIFSTFEDREKQRFFKKVFSEEDRLSRMSDYKTKKLYQAVVQHLVHTLSFPDKSFSAQEMDKLLNTPSFKTLTMLVGLTDPQAIHPDFAGPSWLITHYIKHHPLHSEWKDFVILANQLILRWIAKNHSFEQATWENVQDFAHCLHIMAEDMLTLGSQKFSLSQAFFCERLLRHLEDRQTASVKPNPLAGLLEENISTDLKEKLEKRWQWICTPPKDRLSNYDPSYDDEEHDEEEWEEEGFAGQESEEMEISKESQRGHSYAIPPSMPIPFSIKPMTIHPQFLGKKLTFSPEGDDEKPEHTLLQKRKPEEPSVMVDEDMLEVDQPFTSALEKLHNPQALHNHKRVKPISEEPVALSEGRTPQQLLHADAEGLDKTKKEVDSNSDAIHLECSEEIRGFFSPLLKGLPQEKSACKKESV